MMPEGDTGKTETNEKLFKRICHIYEKRGKPIPPRLFNDYIQGKMSETQLRSHLREIDRPIVRGLGLSRSQLSEREVERIASEKRTAALDPALAVMGLERESQSLETLASQRKGAEKEDMRVALRQHKLTPAEALELLKTAKLEGASLRGKPLAVSMAVLKSKKDAGNILTFGGRGAESKNPGRGKKK